MDNNPCAEGVVERLQGLVFEIAGAVKILKGQNPGELQGH